MTALKEFDRLEASGLWRASAQEQRREVIVSLGDATLTITDVAGRVLAHWSIGAVCRANGTSVPAIYHPDGDPEETLELSEDEAAMVEGVDRLLRAIDRKRPRPGKLRLILGCALAAGIAGAGVFWLPNALRDYAAAVLPNVKRVEIGHDLLEHITRVTGQPCRTEGAQAPLRRLEARLFGDAMNATILVVPGGIRAGTALPGALYVLNRTTVEHHDDVDVVAGYLLAEKTHAELQDPLVPLLRHASLLSVIRLLATGQMSDDELAKYAETLMSVPSEVPDHDILLERFADVDVRSSAFAYALDETGETTLRLIEADPRAQQGSREVLNDGDWLRLQNICTG
jgi:hypothetical protein